MSPEDIERLAALIAAELNRQREPQAAANGPWLPVPVRPQPPGPLGDPPVWSAAAQPLGDIAPIDRQVPSSHRDDSGAATASIRAAAAGHATGRPPAGRGRERTVPQPRSRVRGGSIPVTIGVSNRHVHLSEADATVLFGTSSLAARRALTQPGQFAAMQQVTVVGPGGRIEGIRVVGPARGHSQLELALSDCAHLGITAPILNSGQRSSGGAPVVLEGPVGRLTLSHGVIVAARHLHLAPADAQRWHLADGDRVQVRCGSGTRETTWHDVLVRCGPAHATEFHLDVDEARAAAVSTGDIAHVVAHARPASRGRRLVTEHDVLAIASRGESLPDGAILTPSARDRARALGLANP